MTRITGAEFRIGPANGFMGRVSPISGRFQSKAAFRKTDARRATDRNGASDRQKGLAKWTEGFFCNCLPRGVQ
ncbi:hypothetical protein [Rhodosalinus sp. K401]|uniref:hypothetical protein n=1 Tax=Rhodosalinus sp. K401 TaxID=3239195 RepID=UPI0035238199